MVLFTVNIIQILNLKLGCAFFVYGCVTWSVTLREGYCLRESENGDGKNFWAQEGQSNKRLENYIIGS
jgi:hypothetical protein